MRDGKVAQLASVYRATRVEGVLDPEVYLRAGYITFSLELALRRYADALETYDELRRLTDGIPERHCQTNADRSWNSRSREISGCKLTPLGQGGEAIEFEVLAVIKMTFLIEMIVNRGVGGSKLLQGLDVPEPGHRAFSSPERLV